MSHAIEKAGIKILKDFLKSRNRKVARSPEKTFDLQVDGRPAEVKTKKRFFAEMDFLSFTDNQYARMRAEDFLIFLVSGVGSGREEIFEFNSRDLREKPHKVYSSYEFSKKTIKGIQPKKLKYGWTPMDGHRMSTHTDSS